MTNLKMGKLYILSGLQGSGKSSFLKQFNETMIVSTDKIRESISGSGKTILNGEEASTRSEDSNETVFKIAKLLVEEKCKLGLTVFFDATNMTDKDRNVFVKIAAKQNMDSQILILDTSLEKSLKQNRNRKFPVSDIVIERFEETFQRDSEFNFKIISSKTKINLIPNIIESEDLDIIGDIHGLFNEIEMFVKELGYKITDTSITHKEGRKLAFLGDFIDRGPDSIQVIEFIMKAVNSGHYAIVGNHEAKLIKSYDMVKKGESIKGGHAGKITLVNLMKRKEKSQDRIISFLKNLPFYYLYKNNILAHANIAYANPSELLKTNCIYGSTRRGKEEDTDRIYQELFDLGLNKYNLIRGHIKSTSIQKNVMSLEEGQAFAGYLVCARFNNGTLENTEKFKCSFNYENNKKDSLMFPMSNLVDNKLAIAKPSKNGAMTLFKYSKKVFFDNLWSEDKMLLKARGLVLDLAGNIVQHPFDKVFNYGENDTGIDIKDSTEVIAVEKMNGFLGNIGLDPFTKKLLITTTGSFDSDFVGYIEDFITPKLRGLLLRFLSSEAMTLSFEVIHKEDPHIIDYEDKDRGLWLIGARYLDNDSESFHEIKLDYLAAQFGFKRPKHFKVPFGELKNLVSESNIEGYMVRDIETDLTLLKFKTPYYLVTKFIGRMNAGKIKFMFSNPKKFKMSVDEEFYPLVDIIVKDLSLDDFLNMSNEEKMDFVRSIILKIRS